MKKRDHFFALDAKAFNTNYEFFSHWHTIFKMIDSPDSPSVQESVGEFNAELSRMISEGSPQDCPPAFSSIRDSYFFDPGFVDMPTITIWHPASVREYHPTGPLYLDKERGITTQVSGYWDLYRRWGWWSSLPKTDRIALFNYIRKRSPVDFETFATKLEELLVKKKGELYVHGS